MTTQEAIKVLHMYQKWRRGADIPMPSPKDTGEDIDEAIRVMRKKNSNNDTWI